MKSRFKSILKRNLSAIIFFSVLGFVVLSYVDDRNQKTEQTKELTTFVNGSFGLINSEYNLISNKTFIAEDTIESYDEITTDIQDLIQEIEQIDKEIPRDGIKMENYKQTVTDLEIYLDTTAENLQILAQRYAIEKNILDIKDDYYNYISNPAEVNTREEFDKFLEVYLDVSELQKFTFERTDQEDDSLVERINNLIDELIELQEKNEVVDYPTKTQEIVDKSRYFIYPKLFRISQKRDLQDIDYLDSLEKVQESLTFQRQQFNLKKDD